MSKRIIKLIAERIEFIQEVVSEYNTELSELQIELGQLLGEPDSNDMTFLEAAQRSNRTEIGKQIAEYLKEYERTGGKR